MNELSTSIETLTTEILFYKRQTAQGIIEIGKRLKQAKEMLPHGEFLDWLEKRVEFTRRTASRFIKCSEEFGNGTTSSHLPSGHMFELLSLPSEDREEFLQDHPVEDMTVKQLREAIKAHKEAQEKLADAEEENAELRQANRDLYEKYNAGQQEVTQMRMQVETVKAAHVLSHAKDVSDNSSRREVTSKLSLISEKINNFIKENADVVFLMQNVDDFNSAEVYRLEQSLSMLSNWIAGVRGHNQVIEGEVIHESVIDI